MGTLTNLIQMVILQYMVDSESDSLELTTKRDVWHRLWQAALSTYGPLFPALQRMHFQSDGAFPYSMALGTAIDLLLCAGVLIPSGGHYRVQRLTGSAEFLSERREKMTETEQQALSHMGADTIGHLLAQNQSAA